MPSVLVGFLSGGQPLISGNWWSGQAAVPVGGVQLKVDWTASGYVYVGLSGGMTVNSGGLFGSGFGGRMDGMQLKAGDAYFIPKEACGPSGQLQIYLATDSAGSGQARVDWEAF